MIIRPATKLSDREVVLDDRELEIYLQIQEVATDVCVYLPVDPGGSHGCVRISTGRSRR